MFYKYVMPIILVISSLFIAIARFIVPVNGLNQQDIYKDFAHLFVGCLFGIALISKNKLYYLLFAFLVFIELFASFTRK
jgi:hypothetical protein